MTITESYQGYVPRAAENLRGLLLSAHRAYKAFLSLHPEGFSLDIPLLRGQQERDENLSYPMLGVARFTPDNIYMTDWYNLPDRGMDHLSGYNIESSFLDTSLVKLSPEGRFIKPPLHMTHYENKGLDAFIHSYLPGMLAETDNINDTSKSLLNVFPEGKVMLDSEERFRVFVQLLEQRVYKALGGTTNIFWSDTPSPWRR